MSRWPVRTELERLKNKIIVDSNGCHLWQGFIRSDGYGQFNPSAGVVELAHRASFRLQVGSLLDTDRLLHSCDVKRCVNIAHLRKGTQQDNINDSISKGRFTGRPAKMTKEEYQEISRLLAEKQVMGIKITNRYLADKFNVSESQISKIKRGKIKNAELN